MFVGLNRTEQNRKFICLTWTFTVHRYIQKYIHNVQTYMFVGLKLSITYLYLTLFFTLELISLGSNLPSKSPRNWWIVHALLYTWQAMPVEHIIWRFILFNFNCLAISFTTYDFPVPAFPSKRRLCPFTAMSIASYCSKFIFEWPRFGVFFPVSCCKHPGNLFLFQAYRPNKAKRSSHQPPATLGSKFRNTPNTISQWNSLLQNLARDFKCPDRRTSYIMVEKSRWIDFDGNLTRNDIIHCVHRY